MPEVSIIILNFNSFSYTIDCIESIYENCSGSSFEIIVFDNGSVSFDGDSLAKKFPAVKIFVSEYNLGFGKGNNEAAKNASGKYLLFLNNDIKVLNDIESILKQYLDNNPDVGICGAQQFNDRMEPVKSFNYFPKLFHRVYRIGVLKRFYENKRLHGKYNFSAPVEVDILSGAVLFVRAEFFREIGGFDENIFLYHEEEDIAMQAKMRGLKLVLVPDAHVLHYHAKSSPPKLEVFLEDALSLLYYYKKYHSTLKIGTLRGLLIIKYLGRSLKYRVRKVFGRDKKGFSSIYFQLSKWALSGFPEEEVTLHRQNY